MIRCSTIFWTIGTNSPGEIVALAHALSPEELARAERIPLRDLRERYLASQGGLRVVLGHLLGLQPREVEIVGSTPNKPQISGNRGHLEFNLSHSDNVAVVAVCMSAPIGVDIEATELTIEDDLARSILSESEYEGIMQLSDVNERQIEMYRIWVRKEAALKALGLGLAVDPSAVCVKLDAQGATCIKGNDSMEPFGQDLVRIQDIPTIEGYASALAVVSGAAAYTVAPPVWINPAEMIAGEKPQLPRQQVSKRFEPLFSDRLLFERIGTLGDQQK